MVLSTICGFRCFHKAVLLTPKNREENLLKEGEEGAVWEWAEPPVAVGKLLAALVAPGRWLPQLLLSGCARRSSKQAKARPSTTTVGRFPLRMYG